MTEPQRVNVINLTIMRQVEKLIQGLSDPYNAERNEMLRNLRIHASYLVSDYDDLKPFEFDEDTSTEE